MKKLFLALLVLCLLSPLVGAQSYMRTLRRGVTHSGPVTVTIPSYDPALDPSGLGTLQSVQIESCVGLVRRYQILQANSAGMAIFDGPDLLNNIPFAYSNLDIAGLHTNLVIMSPYTMQYPGGGTMTAFVQYTHVVDTIVTNPADLARFTTASPTVDLVCQQNLIQTFMGYFGSVEATFKETSVVVMKFTYNP